MNELITIPQLFVVVLVIWLLLALGFWQWWTKLFQRPFFSYDMLFLMVAIGLILTRVSGYIAAYIPDNLGLAQIDFSRLTQISDLQLNYLIIPLIPIVAYQFWAMTIEVTGGWQKQTMRLFQFGQLLSLPVLVFQIIRVLNSGTNNVLGYFIALTVLNSATLGLLELYLRRHGVWLKTGMLAILGWSIVTGVLLFGFMPYATGEMVVSILTQLVLTAAIIIPYFSRRYRLVPAPVIPDRLVN